MNNPKDNQEQNATLDIEAIQAKWLPIWEKKQPFNASNDPDNDRKRIYVLDMFSYPSGDLHMGHAEALQLVMWFPGITFKRLQRISSGWLGFIWFACRKCCN